MVSEFSEKYCYVGQVIKIKKESNIKRIFSSNYNECGIYKIRIVDPCWIKVYGCNVVFYYTEIESVNVPHAEPWVLDGEYVYLKDRETLKTIKYVTGNMFDYANSMVIVDSAFNVYYNSITGCYEQNIKLNCGSWIWSNECFKSFKTGSDTEIERKYTTFAELRKFVSESVRVIRCVDCHYWHPEITSNISKNLCLCEMNSPKFPKTDYGYFTKSGDFCPNGSPDPNRDYGYGKLCEINPKYEEY